MSAPFDFSRCLVYNSWTKGSSTLNDHFSDLLEMWLLLFLILIHGLATEVVIAAAPERGVRQMMSLLPVTLGEYKSEKDESYDRNTTFRYMDGAAELYRSFSFQALVVRRYVKTGHPPMVVELFNMGSSEDAFGVFSYETEGEDVGIGQGSEFGGGLLRFWKGRFFLNIYAEKETPSTREDVLQIGRAIAGSIREEGAKPKLLDALPPGFLERSVRYFHDAHRLNHHYFISHENILRLGRGTNVLLASYRFPGTQGRTYLLLIHYPSEKAAGEALRSFLRAYMPEAGGENIVRTEDGKWTAARSRKGYMAVALDAPSPEAAEDLMGAALKKIERK